MNIPGSVAEILVGVAIALVIYIAGIPAYIIRNASTVIKSSRLSRSQSLGLFDDYTIRSAMRYYVRPKYSSIDPARESEPSDALVNARADLFNAISDYLCEGYIEKKHLLILADSGMGKTAFLLNFFEYNQRVLNFRRKKIFLISLAHASADELIGSRSFIERKGINLFLDALDEDLKAIGRVEDRVNEILRLADGYRSVVITCRSQFFRSDNDIPKHTGVPRLGSVPLNLPKHYEFARLYLSPLDSKQVAKFLRNRFPGVWGIRSRLRAKKIVTRIPALSVRPMLLAYMPDLLAAGTRLDSAADVYKAMVEAWSRRESNWVDSQSLMKLSKAIAWDMYSNRSQRGGEFAEPQEIYSIAHTLGVIISEDLVTSRSLLNRTADGKYKFAHRSIMEYFVVDSLLTERKTSSLALTDQMCRFLLERLGCWNAHMPLVFSYCTTNVSLSDPVMCSNFFTNFSLFEMQDEKVSMEDFLREPFEINPSSSPARNVGELLSDMAYRAFGFEAAHLRQMRLLCAPLNIDRPMTTIYISVWARDGAAVAEIKVNTKRLVGLLGIERFSHQELLITAVPAPMTNDLARASWKVASRFLMTNSEERVPNALGTMDRSPRLGFTYDLAGHVLNLRLLESSYDLKSPLGVFGIFGEVESSPVNGAGYGRVGRKRLRVF